jgi:hypothetical protein
VGAPELLDFKPNYSIEFYLIKSDMQYEIKWVQFPEQMLILLLKRLALTPLLLPLSIGLPVANAPDVLQPCGLLYCL